MQICVLCTVILKIIIVNFEAVLHPGAIIMTECIWMIGARKWLDKLSILELCFQNLTKMKQSNGLSQGCIKLISDTIWPISQFQFAQNFTLYDWVQNSFEFIIVMPECACIYLSSIKREKRSPGANAQTMHNDEQIHEKWSHMHT